MNKRHITIRLISPLSSRRISVCRPQNMEKKLKTIINMLRLLLSIVMLAFVCVTKAEDGSKLWLRAEKNVKAKNVVTFKDCR